MKIKEANAGALTNFEVLDFLRSRGASKDPTRVIVPVAQSEFKVYDYLVETAACNQTRDHIAEFLKRCEKFNLAKAEILNLINIRPASDAGTAAIVDSFEDRLEEDGINELLELVLEVLPEPPRQQTSEATGEDQEGTADVNKQGEYQEGTADVNKQGEGGEGTVKGQE